MDASSTKQACLLRVHHTPELQLSRYKTDSEVEDCHMIPQWCHSTLPLGELPNARFLGESWGLGRCTFAEFRRCSGYASKVDKLVPMVGDLEGNIRKVDKRLAFLKLNSTNHHSHVLKKYDVGCGCLTPENLKAVAQLKTWVGFGP